MRTAVMLLLLMACAPGAAGVGRLDTRLGQTWCTPTGPRATVDIDVIEGPDSAFVKKHERKHMEQVRRFPTCRDWYVWYVVNAADAEAEAFCAGATALAAGGDITEPARKAAMWLAYGYPELELTFGEALMRIMWFCV